MKHFKKFFLFFLVFFLGISTGITLYKFNSPPFSQLRLLKRFFIAPESFKLLMAEKSNIFVAKYTKGVPLYSDRPYVDTVCPQELEGLTLIQIPRHSKLRFRIDSKKPLTVYRLTSESNDNWLLDGYQKTDLKVNVVGKSIHREVVKRSYPSGIIDLYAGGPISSSPILLSSAQNESLPMTIFVS
jgi:hypothetical protein